jgi:hypothetical protein
VTLSTPTLIVIAAVVLVEIALYVIALIDLYRRPTSQVVLDNKWVWLAIIVLVSGLGAIAYLAIGRKPAPPAEMSGHAERPREQVENIVDSLYGNDDPNDRS